MHLTKAELQRLKNLVLGQHRDWGALHAALKVRRLVISQSSLDRYFSGKSKSDRTLRTLAVALGTAPEALVSQVRLLTRTIRQDAPADLASVKPLRDPDAFRIAFQLWVEMTTRKLGLPIDPAQDLVAECYDSWYAFFKAARELMKTIPLHKDPQSVELRRLVQISQAVLNDGIRPHLQRWQARFRSWVAERRERGIPAGLSPQETQQLFPEWAALCADLLATNQRLISYVCALEGMVGRPVAPQPKGGLGPKRKPPQRAGMKIRPVKILTNPPAGT